VIPTRHRVRRLANSIFSGDAELCNQISKKAQIYGRDGADGWTGATVCQDPITGQMITGRIRTLLKLPGDLMIPLVSGIGAMGTYIPTLGTLSGFTSMALSGLTRTTVEDSSTGAEHFGHSATALTVTDGAVYRARAIVRVVTGTRFLGLLWKRTGQTAGIFIDPSNGAATAATEGGGTITNATSTSLGGGRYRVEYTMSNAAWGGQISSRRIQHFASASLAANSFDGDGASSWAVEAWSVGGPNVTTPPIGVPEATSRAGDNNYWLLARPTSPVSGEFVSIVVPLFWSASANSVHPAGSNVRIHRSVTGVDEIYRASTNKFDATAQADGGSQQAYDANLAEASGVARMLTRKWDGTALRLYRGATLAASDTSLSPPWVARSDFYVGHVSGPGGHYHCLTGALYVDDGLTAAWRDVLHRYITGKTIDLQG
jgi:hypothetical protein